MTPVPPTPAHSAKSSPNSNKTPTNSSNPTTQLNQSSNKREQASTKLKQADIALKESAHRLKQAANQPHQLGEDVEEFLGQDGFVDEGSLGEEDRVMGEVVREKIGEFEKVRGREAMVELIDVLDRYPGDLDNFMILDGE